MEQLEQNFIVKEVNLAYKYRIYPNSEQAEIINALIGIQRKCWNVYVEVFRFIDTHNQMSFDDFYSMKFDESYPNAEYAQKYEKIHGVFKSVFDRIVEEEKASMVLETEEGSRESEIIKANFKNVSFRAGFIVKVATEYFRTVVRFNPKNNWIKAYITDHRYQSAVDKSFKKAIKTFSESVKNGKMAQKKADYLEKCNNPAIGKKFDKVKFDNICKPQHKSYFDNNCFILDNSKGHISVNLKEKTLVLYPKSKNYIIDMPINRKDQIFEEDIIKFTSANVSKDNCGAYFVSLGILTKRKIPVRVITEDTPCVGIDLGVKTYMVCSDDSEFDKKDNPKIQARIDILKSRAAALYELNKNDKNWERKNYNKIQLKIKKLEKHRTNVRKKQTLDIVNAIIDKHDHIGVENIKVSNLTKRNKVKINEDRTACLPNRAAQKAGLNKAILSKQFYGTVQTIKYKAEWEGKLVTQIDPFYASSKICNCCGHKFKELSLKMREWECTECGSVNDRDKNASKNIRDEAVRVAFLKEEQ